MNDKHMNMHEEALAVMVHDTFETVHEELKRLDNWDDVYEWSWHEYYNRFVLTMANARVIRERIYNMYFKPSGSKF